MRGHFQRKHGDVALDAEFHGIQGGSDGGYLFGALFQFLDEQGDRCAAPESNGHARLNHFECFFGTFLFHEIFLP